MSTTRNNEIEAIRKSVNQLSYSGVVMHLGSEARENFGGTDLSCALLELLLQVNRATVNYKTDAEVNASAECRLAKDTLILMRELSSSKTKEERLQVIDDYKTKCKSTTKINLLKAAGVVIITAVGFALGAAVGFAAGFIPGAFAGSVAGLAVATAVAGAITGLSFGGISSYFFFKPSPLMKKANSIVTEAKHFADPSRFESEMAKRPHPSFN